jgi:ribosomal protein S18 acetylase RimI-like enzyme
LQEIVGSGPFDELIWNALHTVHAEFCVASGAAVRYPADVAPFAAVAEKNASGYADLKRLLVAGEKVYLFGERPEVSDSFVVGEALYTEQMIGPETLPEDRGADDAAIEKLGWQDAGAMVALTDLAFPGFFRTRTCELGVYFGIRVRGELVAMAGERLALPGFREISGVCTHPAYTGKGFARRLTLCLTREHLRLGVRSFLHVGVKNSRARELYDRLGFRGVSSAALWPVTSR